MRLSLLVGVASLAVLGPLAASASAASGYEEQITVDSSQPSGTSTAAWLAAGTTYELSVTGTYVYGNRSDVADAECSTTNGLIWTRDHFGATALHLLVDGQNVDWTPATNVVGCNSVGHAYTLSYTPGADGVVKLAIAAGPGDQASYRGTLEVVIRGSSVATPPSDSGTPADNSVHEVPTPDSTVNHVAPSIATASAAPAPSTSTPSSGNGIQALAAFLLSDQPRATARPEHQVVLETVRPRGGDFQAPSPLIIVPLLVALVVLFKPRQTLAVATDLVRRLPAPGRPFVTTPTPWRVVVESMPSPPPVAASALERPVFTVRAPQPAAKVRFRRRTW